MAILNWRGVTALTPYLLLGVVLWVCVLKSGVHATLAGVVTGLMIPHVSRRNDLDDATEHSPVETLEHALHPWVAYGILPLFAFVNAGLVLGGLGMDRSEEHTSELQSLMRISYAVFCLKNKKKNKQTI